MRRRLSPSLCFAALAIALGCRAGRTAPPASLEEPAPSSSPEHGTALALEAAPAAQEPSGSDGKRLRVLFSGHSLLDNPMPDWVETIAESRGDSLAWQEQIVLGSPIRVRTKGDDPDESGWPGYRLGKSKSGGDVDVLAELKNPAELAHGEKYERLLITERSDFLGAVKWEDTVGYLRDYHDRLVDSGSQDARTLLYQCWPAIDKDAASGWIRYVRSESLAWQCVAAKVNQTLSVDGRRPAVSVVPGGVALAALVERTLEGSVPGLIGSPRERLDRIFSDDAHLTPIGTYLLSALHYGALFGKSPVGAAGPREVPGELVPVLQQIAWETLSSQKADASRPPSLAECRKRIASELCPAYYQQRGKPDEATGCGFWASAESPLSDTRAASR